MALFVQQAERVPDGCTNVGEGQGFTTSSVGTVTRDSGEGVTAAGAAARLRPDGGFTGKLVLLEGGIGIVDVRGCPDRRGWGRLGGLIRGQHDGD